MLKEEGKGLSSFCALTVILNAITSLNLRDLEAEAVAKRAWGVFNRGRLAGFARVVTDFATFGWLCDVVIDPAHRGRGLARRAPSAELRRRGVDESVLRDALATVSDDDEHAAAVALAKRKLRTMSSLPRDVQMRRLIGMLGRKGFSSGLAMSVVREVLATD